MRKQDKIALQKLIQKIALEIMATDGCYSIIIENSDGSLLTLHGGMTAREMQVPIYRKIGVFVKIELIKHALKTMRQSDGVYYLPGKVILDGRGDSYVRRY